VRARYQALVEEIPAILYIDRPGTNDKTLYVSPQVEEILGVSPEEYMADPSFWIEHLHPDDRDRVVEAFERFYATGERTVEDYRMIRPDGRVVWIRDLSRTVREPDGSAVVEQGVMFDITEQKEAEQRVTYLAYHEALTGLPNRLMFGEHLELALARAGRAEVAVAVLFMDIDNLKTLNDTAGHAAGDELLRQVAARVQSVMRPTDLLARQSGDEFLVLLGDIDISGGGAHAFEVAEQVSERIESVFEEPFKLQGTVTSTSVSIGVSAFPLDALDKGELLSHADTAMYRAKQDGGGHHRFYEPEERTGTGTG
jgi:diguanylate cyclase (GGDEF)-like protein/PAS domain S-box-containing protein